MTAASDVWSWGLSVLEMFTGGVTWYSGAAAPLVLEDYARRGNETGGVPLPTPVAEILAPCFHVDPERRWTRMDEVAAALVRLFRSLTKHVYGRSVPVPLAPDIMAYPLHLRDSVLGVTWDDPRDWIVAAIQLRGGNPLDADARLLERRGTRKAQGIADLAAFEDAHQMFQAMADAGRPVGRQLAALRGEKALVHANLDDMGGALSLLDRAIGGYQQLGLPPATTTSSARA